MALAAIFAIELNNRISRSVIFRFVPIKIAPIFCSCTDNGTAAEAVVFLKTFLNMNQIILTNRYKRKAYHFP